VSTRTRGYERVRNAEDDYVCLSCIAPNFPRAQEITGVRRVNKKLVSFILEKSVHVDKIMDHGCGLRTELRTAD